MSRSLYYLTRGDFFINRVVNWFLARTHQIPIYRTKDGFKNLRSNRDTFTRCYDALKDGKGIVIFPEARTILEKRLRPVQRGAARIVFGTNSAYPGIFPTIVPIGVTFINPLQPGRDVFIQVGSPLDTQHFREVHQRDPQEALRLVTEAIEEGMRPLLVDIPSPEREELFNDIVAITDQPPQTFPGVSADRTPLEALQDLARALNRATNDDLHPLREMVDSMRSILLKHRLALRVLEEPMARYSPLAAVLVLPLLIVDAVTSALPRIAINSFVSKIKALPFKGAVRSTAGFFVHAMYYIVLIVLGFVLFGVPGGVIGIVVTMLGYFSYGHLASPRLRDWLYWIGIPGKIRRNVQSMRDQLREDVMDFVIDHSEL